MLSASARVICLNLLIGGYLAECFVLLTANVEDIKRIAKKFLSESLSEQLEGFLNKAKSRDTLSEENERNDQEYNSREADRTRDEYNAYHKQYKTFNYDKKPNLNVNVKQDSQNGGSIFSHRQILQQKRHERNKPNIVANNNLPNLQSIYKQDEHKMPNYGNNQMNYVDETVKGFLNRFSKIGSNQKRVKVTTEKTYPSEFDQYDMTLIRNALLGQRGQALPRVRADGK